MPCVYLTFFTYAELMHNVSLTYAKLMHSVLERTVPSPSGDSDSVKLLFGPLVAASQDPPHHLQE